MNIIEIAIPIVIVCLTVFVVILTVYASIPLLLTLKDWLKEK